MDRRRHRAVDDDGHVGGTVVISLAEPHDALVGLLDEMKSLAEIHLRLCSADTPDPAALGGTRWRLAAVGRKRMDLLVETVFPLLEGSCAGAESMAVSALRAGTTVYRSEVSRYVSRWPTATIVADWALYRTEAERFRSLVSGRLAVERRLLLPLLRRRCS